MKVGPSFYASGLSAAASPAGVSGGVDGSVGSAGSVGEDGSVGVDGASILQMTLSRFL